MSIEARGEILNKSMSRRSLLNGARTAGLGLSAIAIGLTDHNINSSEFEDTKFREPKLLLIPEGFPQDVLTPEELKLNGIKIYNTDNAQLFLRPSSLDFQVFKDVKKGKIDGVVISLVDQSALSWNATSKLGADARFMYQSASIDPSTYSSSDWESLKNYYLDLVTYYQTIEIDPEQEKEASNVLKILENKKNAIKYFSEKGHPSDPQGLYIVPDFWQNFYNLTRENSLKLTKEQEILRRHPEWANKVYIYVSVGGKYHPKIKDNYPRPDWFHIYEYKGKKNEGYDVFPNRDREFMAGSILRHELNHHNLESPRGANGEYEADHGAYDSIVEAWDEYQKSGNNEKYSFVFLTKEGFYYTKRIPQKSPDSNFL